ncbi:MAG: hypothetical protein KDB50_00570 [Mycobacterium sp.]|nr:hypothetical protein [Mycobacterium sp.]
MQRATGVCLWRTASLAAVQAGRWTSATCPSLRPSWIRRATRSCRTPTGWTRGSGAVRCSPSG